MMVCFWQGGWVEQLQSESSGEPGLGWRCAHQLQHITSASISVDMGMRAVVLDPCRRLSNANAN
jgi:hypothetical protein